MKLDPILSNDPDFEKSYLADAVAESMIKNGHDDLTVKLAIGKFLDTNNYKLLPEYYSAVDTIYERALRVTRRPQKGSISLLVDEFIHLTDGEFSVTDAFQYCDNAVTGVTKGWNGDNGDERDNRDKIVVLRSSVRKCLKRLKDGGIIKKVGTRDGVYIADKAEPLVEMDYKGADDTPFDIKLPLGLNETCWINRKNIIVVAGGKSAGKTALLIEIMRLNNGREIDYFNSDSGKGELKRRLIKYQMPIDSWNFKAYPLPRNVSDYINGNNKIYIIDFFEISDTFYRVAGEIERIWSKLQDGIAIIALQKDPKAALGRGGSFSLEKARLYLTLDYVEEMACTKIRIADAKESRLQGGARGLWKHVKIMQGGAKMETLQDCWQKG